MERYSITVSDADSPEPLKLLVPFQSSAKSVALVDEIVKRAGRFGKTLDAKACTLHLDSADGPILDHDDILSDLVFGEPLFGVFGTGAKPQPQVGHHQINAAQTHDEAQLDHSTSAHGIPIRIITPTISRLISKDLIAVPKPAFILSKSAKLQQLHDRAVHHLSNNAPDWLDAASALDLHIHEMPIASTSFSFTLEEIGLDKHLSEGVLDVYAVARSASTSRPPLDISTARVGKNDLYAAGTHWQPEVPHSDRRLSMFLSSLRVFCHVLLSNTVQDKHRDRVLHVFDLLCRFPPAVRALHLLAQGKVITHAASAALAQAIYSVLVDMVPKKLIKNDNARFFEGARLLLGLIMERANNLGITRTAVPVYSSQFQTVPLQLSGQQTLVPVDAERLRPNSSDATHTQHKAMQLKLHLISDSRTSVVIFNPPKDLLTSSHRLHDVVPSEELRNLKLLAALCGKVSLSVLKPSNLSSVAPEHLTFDQAGHLAVYTGRAGCAAPGEDIIIFRPAHGEETPNMQSQNPSPISPQYYNRINLEDTKDCLSKHEIYGDILAAVVETEHSRRVTVASNMLLFLSDLVAEDLESKRVTLNLYQFGRYTYRAEIDKLEAFYAGLKRFEQELVDMVILKAMGTSKQHWVWRIGDPIPGQAQMQPLADEITEIPIALRCPISLELYQDPVIASDGQSYSRQAMTKWMQIRRSSPLTGLMLDNTELRPDLALAEHADNWHQGEGLTVSEECPQFKRRRTSLQTNSILFSSPSHVFSRTLPPSTSIVDLYKVAFRGMRGRYSVFQLSFNGYIAPSSDTISSRGIQAGSTVTITVRAENNISCPEDSSLCLVKVYGGYKRLSFSYWIPRDTRDSMACILAKYWRYTWATSPWKTYEKKRVWTDLRIYGDERYRGNISKNCESIANYLTPEHAFGSLLSEPVDRQKDTDAAFDSPGEDEESVTPVLVLKVKINACREHEKGSRGLTRLAVLKQMFEAMINRIIAYSYKTHIGLVTFSTTAKVSQSITHVVENFRRSVQSMHADGDTALWDGLKLAHSQLMEYAKKYPEAQRRIICLSDGNDNKSTAGPADLSWQLRQDKIAVDSVCIGNDDNVDLRAVSNILGSYSFFPKDLTTALAICEMEPVLSQTERPPANTITPAHRTSALNHFYSIRNSANFTTVTQDVFPKRKEHDRLHDTFIQLADCVRTTTGRNAALPTLRNSRLLVEMHEMAANPHPKYDCYVSEAEMSFWKIVIEGPSETPYADSTFLMYLEMPENFPVFPPKGRFVTPLFHPNINRHGRICHSIFDRDWTTDTSLHNVLDTVYGLLLQAEASDAVHTTVTLGFHHDEVAFADEARRHARKHGKKTREEWKKELLDEE